jgi:hypothetical protein
LFPAIAICAGGKAFSKKPLLRMRQIAKWRFWHNACEKLPETTMKTQTIFSDPLIGHSIACAISRRSGQAAKRGFFSTVFGWARPRSRRS